MALSCVETGPCSGSLAGRVRLMTSGATDPTVEDIELLDSLLGMSVSKKLKARRATGYGRGVQKTRQLVQRSWTRDLKKCTCAKKRVNHWVFLPRSMGCLKSEAFPGAVGAGEFETVRRYVDSDSGLSDDPASGRYICGEVLTVTAQDLAVADSEFGEGSREVIEVQSTLDSSYIVRAYAYLRFDAMNYSS
mmetsp:Transcript_28378/g.111364  ORF Transcript_28378/g.111364 Transcript_28378/m.111364 type:complete len:191 (-) Transcript_28378:234-806(-)|eukprot:CAMPEP_0113964932 /NCGR_PEP_ID=MMETSP0011_2-20120614/7452_1 /TAXON_ID=101924 /ORGANISM="Rhodosorus marinus" /LENGTH=190 /DNA_ID=CAMNT_0000977365 /DNA_START=102 /DNA_END=674 /DNA_ORIENTATION=+ /assembly_acc=CAM_ASM_000156